MKAHSKSSRILILAFLPLLFVLYSNGFKDFSIDKQHDALGDADAGYYSILIKDFNLKKKYGDEYSTSDRDFADRAQKHKIHHVLYVIVAGAMYRGILLLGSPLGVTSGYALYSVNATITCLNVFLFFLLLNHFNRDPWKTYLFTAVYAFSLSTWVYASIPDSWSFTATLVILFLILFHNRKVNPYILAALLGAFMLNNIFLICMTLFLYVQALTTTDLDRRWIRLFSYPLISMGTWASLLTLLSLFDRSLTPFNYFRYLFWFKDYISYKFDILDPYVWKVIWSNLYVNSVLSNQPDPRVPPESLIFTFRGSVLGTVSTTLFICFSAVTVWYFISRLRKKRNEGSSLREICLQDMSCHLAAFCFLWVLIVLNIHPPGAFLYSTVSLPVFLLFLNANTDWGNARTRAFLTATTVMIIVNNAVQIWKFRLFFMQT